MESIACHGGRALLLLDLQIVSFGPSSLASSCPAETNLIYAPFTPFDQAEYTALNNETDNACWWWAIFLLSSADAARVQQFAATSLVMGLVPPTLKDIAWPERRVVSISRQPPRLLEVIVRALGAVPSIDTFSPEKQAIASTTLYEWALKLTRKCLILWLALSAFSLLLSYGILAVVEVYSKRSSLGCPYPIFILTWNLFAIFPAALDTAFRRPVREHTLGVVSQPNTDLELTKFLGGGDDIEQNKQLLNVAVNDSSLSRYISQSPGEIRHRHVAQTTATRPSQAV